MLRTLEVNNFTVFSKAKFEFAAGLNVIVGENGAGKTHVLKLGYTLLSVAVKRLSNAAITQITKSEFEIRLIDKLMGVFKPDGLGKLIRRVNRGNKSCEVSSIFGTGNELSFSFSKKSNHVSISKTPDWIEKPPVYLPARELLTIYPGFVSLYENSSLPFEETWRDTCLQLGLPLARGPREKRIKELLEPLEVAMGGNISADESGRFYLHLDGVPMEMHLVAEGLRKLAMVARLIATGALIDKGNLFWDEPEANLNPKVIKLIARTILHLCQNGIQVFIASHSLFLLRELDILLKHKEYKDIPTHFIGLHKSSDGVKVQQGTTIDDVGDISALQEELSQSDRYIHVEEVTKS